MEMEKQQAKYEELREEVQATEMDLVINDEESMCWEEAVVISRTDGTLKGLLWLSISPTVPPSTGGVEINAAEYRGARQQAQAHGVPLAIVVKCLDNTWCWKFDGSDSDPKPTALWNDGLVVRLSLKSSAGVLALVDLFGKDEASA